MAAFPGEHVGGARVGPVEPHEDSAFEAFKTKVKEKLPKITGIDEEMIDALIKVSYGGEKAKAMSKDALTEATINCIKNCFDQDKLPPTIAKAPPSTDTSPATPAPSSSSSPSITPSTAAMAERAPPSSLLSELGKGAAAITLGIPLGIPLLVVGGLGSFAVQCLNYLGKKAGIESISLPITSALSWIPGGFSRLATAIAGLTFSPESVNKLDRIIRYSPIAEEIAKLDVKGIGEGIRVRADMAPTLEEFQEKIQSTQVAQQLFVSKRPQPNDLWTLNSVIRSHYEDIIRNKGSLDVTEDLARSILNAFGRQQQMDNKGSDWYPAKPSQRTSTPAVSIARAPRSPTTSGAKSHVPTPHIPTSLDKQAKFEKAREQAKLMETYLNPTAVGFDKSLQKAQLEEFLGGELYKKMSEQGIAKVEVHYNEVVERYMVVVNAKDQSIEPVRAFVDKDVIETWIEEESTSIKGRTAIATSYLNENMADPDVQLILGVPRNNIVESLKVEFDDKTKKYNITIQHYETQDEGITIREPKKTLTCLVGGDQIDIWRKSRDLKFEEFKAKVKDSEIVKEAIGSIRLSLRSLQRLDDCIKGHYEKGSSIVFTTKDAMRSVVYATVGGYTKSNNKINELLGKYGYLRL